MCGVWGFQGHWPPPDPGRYRRAIVADRPRYTWCDYDMIQQTFNMSHDDNIIYIYVYVCTGRDPLSLSLSLDSLIPRDYYIEWWSPLL